MPNSQPGRNDPCPCGSNLKYKNCCLKQSTASTAKVVHTHAGKHLDELQRKYPLTSRMGAGRVEKLFRMLLPILPASIQQLVATGDLVAGGTSRPEVLVRMEPVKDGFVIEMTVQFMRFLYAVSRTMAGCSNINYDDRPSIQAVLSKEELDKHLKDLAELWKSQDAWNNPKTKYPEFPLPLELVEQAELRTSMAEMFILAHEVGHVMANRFPDQCKLPAGYSPAQSEELWCDGFAMETVLSFCHSGAPGNPVNNMRIGYAAALYAVRMCDWLETMGFNFGVVYPPADERVETVRRVTITHLGEEGYELISPIGLAIEDMLWQVEGDLGIPRTRQEPLESLSVRIGSVVEEITHGRLDHASACKTLNNMLQDKSESRLSELAGRLYDRFVSVAEPQEHPIRQLKYNIGRELLTIAPLLQEPARSIFQKCFSPG